MYSCQATTFPNRYSFNWDSSHALSSLVSKDPRGAQASKYAGEKALYENLFLYTNRGRAFP